jgi:hypothetical protein
MSYLYQRSVNFERAFWFFRFSQKMMEKTPSKVGYFSEITESFSPANRRPKPAQISNSVSYNSSLLGLIQ